MCFPHALFFCFWQNNGLSTANAVPSPSAGHLSWSCAADGEHEEVETMLVRKSLRNNACLRVVACTAECGDQAPLSLRSHTSSEFHSFASTFLPHQGKFIASQLLFTAFRQCYPAGGGLGHAVHDAALGLYFSKLYTGRVDLRSLLSCL